MKAKRHMKIREIIKEKPIETQEELAEELRKQGFNVTQATVSRDIKELRLIKVLRDNEHYCYAEPDRSAFISDKLLRMLRESIISIASSENLIVIKTLSGTASAAAEAIDGLNWDEIIGTIAGDNTILVVASAKSAVKDIVEKFENIIK
ncbi:MAG: transcriptional regulator of arginine metabolism [Thermoanaerobacteraceae bacterium]|uniref:Arginine repressor n=1 Tax=Biomaibacter acetigenes TaxID=2316383 RepID=A0A3G2R5E5_9FIRM|nr:arginine repressor [Biomaibacter acetigenes]AYO30693.1 arginine repressor [Biomaibacter acetigenes]MDK2878458.1 transcriptional regulator of arginine metabolism [Thermoanaerobacteraceae bacterium]MDN5312784.1 transcriptional regulator of arginine metabolism [Thermoanaerobacteraceae bacterium]RKL64214.1 arginine repressor [Thermoanaerobacteraceae bacterium SP2]